MRGEIVVVRDAAAPVPPHREHGLAYWEEPPPVAGATLVERGRWLFKRHGCFNCHGEGGKGGVANFNYIKDSVPALNTIASTIALDEKKDAEKIVALLENGEALKSDVASPPVPRWKLVYAKYDLVRQTIREGRAPGKKDAKGLTPPLEMPAWGQRLSERDIDAIIAYLITLEPWDEVKKKDEAKDEDDEEDTQVKKKDKKEEDEE
jgi:mono/diheme cytochrome c family protein